MSTLLRRDILALVGGVAVALSGGVRAQQKAMPVIGWLSNLSIKSSTLADAGLAAFREGLSKAGYVEGQNVAIEYRCRRQL